MKKYIIVVTRTMIAKVKVKCDVSKIFMYYSITHKKKITWKFLEYKTCIKSLISSTKIILIKDNNEKDKI
jgi:hypothetical protein